MSIKTVLFLFLSVVSLLWLLVYYRVYLNRKRKPLQCNQGSTLSFWWRYLFFQSESSFVYQAINKTKLSITNFPKQSPWNILIKESKRLNNTICYNNTFCRVYINNLQVWGNLMQLCHNEISLDTLWKKHPNPF